MYKPVTHREASRYLRDVGHSDKHFYGRDGRVLKNLVELYAFVKGCGDDTLRHHVDGSKNDFANWVRGVIGDEELAEKLENCVIRQPMQYRLLKRINQLASSGANQPGTAERASMLLEGCAPDEAFISRDGRELRSLWELHDFVKTADVGSFGHHVNADRNDIADWVENVICDEELSKRLRGVKDRRDTAGWIALRIKALGNLKAGRPGSRGHRAAKKAHKGYCAEAARAVGKGKPV